MLQPTTQPKRRSKQTRASVTVLLIPEGDLVTAYCPALDWSTYGTSNADAKKAFKEALDILIDDLTQKNRLDEDLLNHGWTIRKFPSAEYKPPVTLHLPFFAKKPAFNYIQSFSIPVS